MKFKIMIAATLMITSLGFSQNSPQAEAILGKVSKTLEAQKNISIEFTHTLENKVVNIKQSSQGSAIIEGDKYVLNYLDNIILFDEQKNYVISPENEEINITKADDIDDESLTPSKLLSFYKKGYTYQLAKKSGNIQFIKLIPTKDSEEVSHIMLGVNTVKNQISSLTEVGKNGTNTTFDITNYQTNQTLAPTTFVFNKAKYKALDYYINE
ncbi:outer membrane lipoprotein-sorting protein [Wenyingzhuangia heitensis]|uniref:Outer membrane lipoprotein-sorting protein n=1 Tax=Wenyingzhuangia heitensis TaxID=1487859 RepID=A0ABX0U9J1_9FLAO|nr:outer membrane lipoprotein carrier protein LolA [Wenyingzhuangia heitensis]NIJ45494.1 outer membrane lipoprotein-sorting protein [Wenyingzhuangia heitensis]